MKEYSVYDARSNYLYVWMNYKDEQREKHIEEFAKENGFKATTAHSLIRGYDDKEGKIKEERYFPCEDWEIIPLLKGLFSEENQNKLIIFEAKDLGELLQMAKKEIVQVNELRDIIC